MNQQPLRLEGLRSTWRAASRDSAALAFEPAAGAAVIVSWASQGADGATSLESRQIELPAERELGFGTATLAAWTCRTARWGWLAGNPALSAVET